jgi:Cytidylate kinase-like family
MGYRAIALSQVDGAGGEFIGRDLARKLGFGYLNEAIVAQVAQDHGVDQAIVVGAERRKSFFTRVAEMAARGAVDVAPDPSLYVPDETDTLLSLIRDAVRDAADRGSVVLLAHAACYACAGRADVLRVCVTAPLPARASRVASALGLSDQEAAKSLRRSDAGRASYLKRVYGVGRESPADYDVVLNTERLAPDAAAGLILGLVQARPAAPPPSPGDPGASDAR